MLYNRPVLETVLELHLTLARRITWVAVASSTFSLSAQKCARLSHLIKLAYKLPVIANTRYSRSILRNLLDFLFILFRCHLRTNKVFYIHERKFLQQP